MRKENNANAKKNNKANNNVTAKHNAPEMKNGVGNDLANDNRKSDNNTTAADAQDM